MPVCLLPPFPSPYGREAFCCLVRVGPDLKICVDSSFSSDLQQQQRRTFTNNLSCHLTPTGPRSPAATQRSSRGPLSDLLCGALNPRCAGTAAIARSMSVSGFKNQPRPAAAVAAAATAAAVAAAPAERPQTLLQRLQVAEP